MILRKNFYPLNNGRYGHCIPVNEVPPLGTDKPAVLNVWPGKIIKHPNQELCEPAASVEHLIEWTPAHCKHSVSVWQLSVMRLSHFSPPTPSVSAAGLSCPAVGCWEPAGTTDPSSTPVLTLSLTLPLSLSGYNRCIWSGERKLSPDCRTREGGQAGF